MNDIMTKKEAALAYAADGFKVFPLVKDTKIPACKNGVKDATSDSVQIERWWADNPDANIGMACGCGIAVVDIDRHNGVDGMKSIEAAGFDLPKTLTQNTPSGGLHLVCRGDGIRNATNVNNLQGVDVRGEGGYIVVSPSVVNGVVYRWQDVNTRIADFPAWAVKKKSVIQPSFIPSNHMGDVSVERVKSYLAKMPAAVQGQGGHDALLKAAEVVAVRFALPKEQAKSLLWSEYNPRCQPPWDFSISKDRRDFERKVDEALKNPRHTFGDLRDSSCLALNVAQDEVDAGRRIAFGGRLKAHEFTRDESVRRIILNPPGIVGEIAEWITENSPMPVPLFAIVGALSVVGTVFARSITYGNTMTNPYFFVIGPAQSGKTSAFNLAWKILNEIQKRAGCESHEFFMTSTVTSDAAIYSHLQREGRLTLVVDECAGFFAQAKGQRKNGGHMASIADAVKELYSVAPGGRMNTKMYADDRGGKRDPYKCDGACFSLIGGTQPAVFANVIGDEEILDGFLARFIFVAQTTYPKPNRKHERELSPMPEHAVNALASFLMGCEEKDTSIPEKDGKRYLAPENHNLILSPEADRMIEEMTNWQYDVKVAEMSDPVVNNLVGRCVENMKRVALIVAAGKHADDLSSAVIDEESVTFAKTFVKTAYDDLVEYCREAGGSSDYDRFKDRIVDFVRRKGPVTKGQISQGVRGAKGRKYRDEAIEDVINEGKVKNTGGVYEYCG